jgi:hypothetical protein
VIKTQIAPDTASLSQTGGGTIIELRWRCSLWRSRRVNFVVTNRTRPFGK